MVTSRKIRKRMDGFFGKEPACLFVPSKPMLDLHEHSKPSAILKRLGLSPSLWESWKRRHPSWVLNWLYGDELPDGVKLHYWCWQRRNETAAADGWAPEPEMKLFRAEATQNAVGRVVTGRPADTDLLRDADQYDYSKVLKHHGTVPWMRSYLFRGEEAPEGFKVATRGQFARATAAWDYVAHRETAGVKEIAFLRWFSNGIFPTDVALRLPFLLWLYGGDVPYGWTFITERMRALRDQRTPEGVCAAAAISLASYSRLRKTPEGSRALDAAIEHAAKSTAANGATLEGHQDWNTLDPRLQRSAWAYAQAANLTRCCERVVTADGGAEERGINKQEYTDWLREARRRATEAFGERAGDFVAENLRRYLDGLQDAAEGRSFQHRGILLNGLYYPPKGMWKFRTVAKRAMTEQTVSTLFKELPNVREWMLAAALPPLKRRDSQQEVEIQFTRTVAGIPGDEGIGVHKSRIVNSDEIAKAVWKHAPKPSQGSARLTIHLETASLTLDGSTYKDLDPTTLRIIQALHEHGGAFVSSKWLGENVPGCKGGEKTIRNRLKRLPEDVQILVDSQRGVGRRLRLPILDPSGEERA